jgi:hypothetical protein
MNERIKQFAQQAGFKVDWQHADVQAIKMARYERFAELIVQECLDQCYNRGMNDELYSGQLRAAEYIKQHFGITK